MENQQEKNNAVPIWGGIECTVHRLRNSYGNQLFRNGHHSRISDLDLIAELGIKTLRYPVVWESIAPEGLKTADWSWIDERLYRLKELGINPIASFLHHGSGPKYTSLIDPQFPEKLTEFAVAVAERYPWLELFTPVNEPLTTARFSCLYGHWYPHTKDHHAFSIALLNECKGTIMAMKEIKKIIPNAKLVQTEDLGKCHATEKLQYQCDFENERRWVTFDLLTGRIEENEMMMEYFKGKGKIEDSDLAYFKENNYAPDVVGINYYITSERALDENYKKYPKWSYAVNDNNEKYANVEIVRADINKREGHYKLLKEAADRYKLPVAFTEVHLGATRDEQLRWFMEAYEAVTKLKDEGVDVKGITVWSVLGAYDWNTLLTQNNNFYEPGVFDVRSGTPRPTAIAWLVKTLSEGQQPDHPVLHAEGWWKNPGTIKIMFGNKAKARQLPTIENQSGVDHRSYWNFR
jgi:dTDP-4-dehydrorhamnose reductase